MTTRVALITGGGRGLGRSLVSAFISAGYQVATCGRTVPDPDVGATDVGATDVRVTDVRATDVEPPAFFACDVRDPEQVTTMMSELEARYGRLDVLVNNAGGTPYAAAADMSPRLFERVVALNLLGPFYVAQQANRVMQAQPEGGVIVNIGSTSAVRPAAGCAPYVAAKTGLTGLTRALALEWAPKVRVLQVTPGLMRTELVSETYGTEPDAVAATIPAGRFGTGDDVAAACLALCGEGMDYVTGSELIVDGGGETPAWLLRYKPASAAGGGE